MLEDKVKTEMRRLRADGDPEAEASIREYVNAIENGEPYGYEFDEYRKIAECGDFVLIGRERPGLGGYEFLTVEDGFWGPIFTDEYEKAKQDFVIRSGLIKESLLIQMAPESPVKQAENRLILDEKVKAEMQRIGAGNDPDIRRKVREYVGAVENNPPFKLTDPRDGYHKIAEYGKIVFAGRQYPEADYGYEFVTWEYSYDRKSVGMGNYIDNTLTLKYDIFDKAKQDFVARSGLVDERLIFKSEQLVSIYEVLDLSIREGLLETQEKNIEKIMEQIEHVLPEITNSGEPGQSPKLGM